MPGRNQNNLQHRTMPAYDSGSELPINSIQLGTNLVMSLENSQDQNDNTNTKSNLRSPA